MSLFYVLLKYDMNVIKTLQIELIQLRLTLNYLKTHHSHKHTNVHTYMQLFIACTYVLQLFVHNYVHKVHYYVCL